MIFFFQIKPIVEKEYNFNEVPQAYDKVLNGHGRGKVVIDFTKESSTDESKQTVSH